MQRVDPVALHRVFLNDVECSFLLAFCESQHCAESLLFIIAVEKFRHLLYGERRLMAWKTFEELDDLGDAAPKKMHEKLGVAIDQIRKEANSIWENFFSVTSKFEICCPSGIITNVKRRLKYIEIFGPEAFSEALVDPLKTMFRDIWPRYALSALYREMEGVTSQLSIESKPSDLCVPFPNNLVHVTYTEDMNLKESVNEIMENVYNYMKDPLLYGEFLVYLRRVYASENLLCVRSIERYEDFAMGNAVISAIFNHEHRRSSLTTLAATTVSTRGGKVCVEAKDQAWMIYRYFLCKEACLEVSVSQQLLESMLSHLANPYPSIFEEVKEMTIQVLTSKFDEFKASADFQDLVAMVLKREEQFVLELERLAQKNGGSKACIIS